MSVPQVLANVIGKVLKPAGFKRKASSWYLDRAETITVVNLQKSSFGPQYYINIAVWLKALGNVEAPKEQHCHVRFRWETIIPLDAKYLERLLNLADSSIVDEERARELGSLLDTYVVPFLKHSASLVELQTIYGTKHWPVSLVRSEAQDLLRTSDHSSQDVDKRSRAK